MDHESAVKLFDYCAKKKAQGYVCSHEITTLAYQESIDFLVTRDLKDFKKSRKKVYTAAEAVLLLESEENTLPG